MAKKTHDLTHGLKPGLKPDLAKNLRKEKSLEAASRRLWARNLAWMERSNQPLETQRALKSEAWPEVRVRRRGERVVNFSVVFSPTQSESVKSESSGSGNFWSQSEPDFVDEVFANLEKFSASTPILLPKLESFFCDENFVSSCVLPLFSFLAPTPRDSVGREATSAGALSAAKSASESATKSSPQRLRSGRQQVLCAPKVEAVSGRLPARADTALHAPHLMIIGLGLGLVVEEILRRNRQLATLIIIEPSPLVIKAAFHARDFGRLARRLEARGGELRIIVAQSIEEARRLLLNLGNLYLFEALSVTCLQLYKHAGEFSASMAAEIDRHGRRGFGFIEDMANDLGNSFNNVAVKKHPVAFFFPMPSTKLPIFVVAAGPSLEAALPEIKKRHQGAIVISCGSVLRRLLDEGIVPDFHCMLENQFINDAVEVDVIKDHRDVVSTITLFASTTCVASSSAYFKRAILFTRPGNGSELLLKKALGGHVAMRNTGMVVGNVGLVLATLLNGEALYLFGLDNGARAGAQSDRVAGTWHRRGRGKEGYSAEYRFSSQQRRANFGGAAVSDEILTMAYNWLASTIADCPSLVYNCSDGVLFEHAIAMVPEKVPMPGARAAETKRRALERIDKAFPIHQPEPARLLAALKEVNHQRRELSARIRSLIGECVGDGSVSVGVLARRAFWRRLNALFRARATRAYHPVEVNLAQLIVLACCFKPLCFWRQSEALDLSRARRRRLDRAMSRAVLSALDAGDEYIDLLVCLAEQRSTEQNPPPVFATTPPFPFLESHPLLAQICEDNPQMPELLPMVAPLFGVAQFRAGR